MDKEFYTPQYVYILYDNVSKLKLRKNNVVYYKELMGSLNNGFNIYSPVSGIIKGTTQMQVENDISSFLVIENNYKDKPFKVTGGKEKTDLYKRKEAKEILESFNLPRKYNAKKHLIVDLSIKNNHLENQKIINEKGFEILETIDALLTIFSLEGASVLVNDNISKSFLERYIGMYPNIKFVSKITKSDNVLIYNGYELSKVYYALKYNKTVCEKYITIVSKTEVITVKTKINILISELLNYLNVHYGEISIINYNNDKITNYNGILTENIKTIIVS